VKTNKLNQNFQNNIMTNKIELNLICQSKGGSGKTLLGTLIAHVFAQRNHKNVLFVDMDSSTNSLSKNIAGLIKDENKERVSLLNNKQVLVRDLLISYIESLSDLHFTKIYADMGSPESEQLPSIFNDLNFAEFCDELKITVKFHIVITAGGYLASIEYLKKMLSVVNSDSVVVWRSITSFTNYANLTEELRANCNQLQLQLREFGDFDPSSNLGNLILTSITKSIPLSEYSTGARIKMKGELVRNFSPEMTDGE
jgi:MinD-like ATPase involved in chromosome partitioning or flagellar assembly